MKPIRRLLAANRSEIAIRVFRSAHELGIRTVAMYSHEDRYALHRFKADEAYLIGEEGKPLQAYLNIPGVIELAKEHAIDAIHPGYGFLSENPEFAQACADAGITFVGPRVDLLENLGDKLEARKLATKVGVPVLGGSAEAIVEVADGLATAEKLGFPIILKAAHGGGGRGMRVVTDPKEFESSFEAARRESLTAFGSPEIFVEKYIQRARHIEVQLLGDRHGNLVHLFERDCSVQRRHQKVVEIAPAPNLPTKVRNAICEAALEIGRAVKYDNAGTVEFLVDADTHELYFIEVNPRIQVEHTVTEEVTGIDVVRSQILIAQGEKLTSEAVGLASQEDIKTTGFAVQCRVTTENPSNRFMPDYGRLTHYRSAGGMGIRLDAGTAFSGAVVYPFYDSLLVKVTAWGRNFEDATRRSERCLQEFRVRGVKTNIPFLIRLVTDPVFLAGECTTRFIDDTPELFDFVPRRDRATRLLQYISEVIVNGSPIVGDKLPSLRRTPVVVPDLDECPLPKGTRDRLKELGVEGFARWVKEQKPLLWTDTTMRDAHQSLLATRFRTFDLCQIADAYARLLPELFSIEMWGGATFDTSMRFLKESPWKRLELLREKIPNILFQMLLRASSAMGYANYPDNLVELCVREAADAGIDVFRIFDALNWTPNMRVAMEAVQKTDAICEAAICYSGDILDPARSKYDLKYYVMLAKELEQMGAHILAIKDMAGLCKPHAAEMLVKALRDEVDLPIHFHTHDTGGVQASAILNAAEMGLDIADGALAAMSGGTSQPNLNTMVEGLRFTPRASTLSSEALDRISDYWREAREFYSAFESPTLAAGADLYQHEMPGGQYTNLFQQAHALGLSSQWAKVCKVYADVNQLFGDIVKVTPTSKAVGDMALFLVAHDMSCAELMESDRELAFPRSVLDLLSGRMGQVEGGFPTKVRDRILRDEKPLEGRPGESLPPADLNDAKEKVAKMIDREPTQQEIVAYLMYPQVFEQYAAHWEQYSDTSLLPTPVFLHGMDAGEEISVVIEPGKTLIIKFLTVGDPHADGTRSVFFELNGHPRDVTVHDRSLENTGESTPKADPNNAKQIGSAMPGMVVLVAVEPGDAITQGQKLMTLEAMKMETTIAAESEGKVAQVHVGTGSQVEAGDLLITLE
ncbi:pyruvate carboxylase [Bythopirellula goksoeyrii]|uniref:Pyruvate carboxylase n=1 Tax=Bythopirellula goksoeyrii TaxID=1400387 RepID=A0A5B9QV96_9BACT|nr:pyruvate carboxylase [Bythopirellula goksoeyrii]QEG37931.1 2-oxoglutarate carboxylase small subunit [Bythopirellula goksoeyrii]